MNWPCPNCCLNWARSCEPTNYQPNHHPKCEHFNEILIDVWKVSDGSSAFYIADEGGSRREAECEGIEVTKEKMHREVYDSLPEFGGF